MQCKGTIWKIQIDSEGESKVTLLIPEIYRASVQEAQMLLKQPLEIIIEPERADGEKPSNKDINYLQILLDQKGWQESKREGYILYNFGKHTLSELTKNEIQKFIQELSTGTNREA
ncbi:MAG: hypothetical protein AB1349_07570 [Elusimicrobiota bacterium]